MRVLHVQKVKGIGGAERHLLSLLPGLAANGVEVGIVVIASDEADGFVEAMRSNGVPVHTVDAPKTSLSPGLARRLSREIRSFRPDVVHTHLIHADLHGQLAAWRRGVPSVSSVHSVHDFYGREPYRSAARLAGRLAARTIAISRFAGEFLLANRIVGRARLRVVHYGIDPSGWTVADQTRDEARRNFGLPLEGVVVGVAARLIEGKGHVDAIRAMKVVRGGVTLAIAGEGPEGQALRRMADELGGDHVRFLGFVSDVPRFMDAVDVVCFPTRPSLGEGFGLAALEAMAAGRPVIASRVASFPRSSRTGGRACSCRQPIRRRWRPRSTGSPPTRRNAIGWVGPAASSRSSASPSNGWWSGPSPYTKKPSQGAVHRPGGES